MADEEDPHVSESTGLLKKNNKKPAASKSRPRKVVKPQEEVPLKDSVFDLDEEVGGRRQNFVNANSSLLPKQEAKLKKIDLRKEDRLDSLAYDSDDPHSSANEVLARFLAAQQHPQKKTINPTPNPQSHSIFENFYVRLLLIFISSLLLATMAFFKLRQASSSDTPDSDDHFIVSVVSNISILVPSLVPSILPTFSPSPTTSPLNDSLVPSDDISSLNITDSIPTLSPSSFDFLNTSGWEANFSLSPSLSPSPTPSSSPSPDSLHSVQHPNIIFVLADDLGWNSLGYQDYDLSFATPFLTGLAEQGIIMSSYYAQEVCTPSRASLLTGRYPLTIGMQYSIIMPTTSWGLNLSERLLPQVLKEEAGYDTYMLGKWHLGHYSPRYLPTARGFDSFLGYLSGENYYWSKKNPDHIGYSDLLSSDTSCYSPYMEEDLHEYSTFLYRDKAIEIIEKQNSSVPFFLYLAFQAVHDPFMDVQVHEKGVPKEYLREGVYESVREEVVGHKRRQYAMALSLLDDSVSLIFDAVKQRGMENNTYLIFASDNGGCYVAGGKNGPLRGTKGSLFEGGVKVDSFIYSPSLPLSLQGSIYDGLFHVSDWFPTILNLTSIPYSSPLPLDGVDQVRGWLGEEEQRPRSSLLYNAMYNVDGYYFNMNTNGSFAVRNDQFKLMHTYDSPVYGTWWQVEDSLDNDDSLAEGTCNQALAMSGTFTYYLFDLLNDPYETVNLYSETDEQYVEAKEELYSLMAQLQTQSSSMTADIESRNLVTLPVWNQHSSYIVPWVKTSDLDLWDNLPQDCYVSPAPTQIPTPSPSNPNDTNPPTPNPSPSRSPPTNKPSTSTSWGPPSPPTFSTPTFSTPTFSTPTFSVPSIYTSPTIVTPPALSSPTFSGPTPPVPTTRPSPSPSLQPSAEPSPSPSEPLTEPPSSEPSPDPSLPPSPSPTSESEEKDDDDGDKDDDKDSKHKGDDDDDEDKDNDEPSSKPTKKPTYSPTSQDDDDWDDDDDKKKKSDDDWDDDDDDSKHRKDDDWDDDDDKKKQDDDDWDDD